jgi:flagellar biosynthesis/type III secretory pathway chaperone
VTLTPHSTNSLSISLQPANFKDTATISTTQNQYNESSYGDLHSQDAQGSPVGRNNFYINTVRDLQRKLCEIEDQNSKLVQKLTEKDKEIMKYKSQRNYIEALEREIGEIGGKLDYTVNQNEFYKKETIGLESKTIKYKGLLRKSKKVLDKKQEEIQMLLSDKENLLGKLERLEKRENKESFNDYFDCSGVCTNPSDSNRGPKNDILGSAG